MTISLTSLPHEREEINPSSSEADNRHQTGYNGLSRE